MKLKLRGKLISSMGILIFVAVLLISSLSYLSLQRAYDKNIEAEKEKLDQIIQSQVECMIGVLQAEYDKYQNGDITAEEAMEMRSTLFALPDIIMELVTSGQIWQMEQMQYILILL